MTFPSELLEDELTKQENPPKRWLLAFLTDGVTPTHLLVSGKSHPVWLVTSTSDPGYASPVPPRSGCHPPCPSHKPCIVPVWVPR